MATYNHHSSFAVTDLLHALLENSNVITLGTLSWCPTDVWDLCEALSHALMLLETRESGEAAPFPEEKERSSAQTGNGLLPRHGPQGVHPHIDQPTGTQAPVFRSPTQGPQAVKSTVAQQTTGI